MFIANTAFLMLADNAKQAKLVGWSGIYLSKLRLMIIIFQVEYLGVYVYILYFSFSDHFYLVVAILCGAMFSTNR